MANNPANQGERNTLMSLAERLRHRKPKTMLVATHETQGQLPTDFNFCEEGEPVTMGYACDGEKTWDGPCGCRRCLNGVNSKKGTTTFKVVPAPANGPILGLPAPPNWQVGWILEWRDGKWLRREANQSVPLEYALKELAEAEVSNE
jgi:hypothetical protein